MLTNDRPNHTLKCHGLGKYLLFIVIAGMMVMLLYGRRNNNSLESMGQVHRIVTVPFKDGTSKVQRTSRRPRAGMSCFMHYASNDDHDIFWLEDVLTSNKQPTQGKNIFFHETSCLYDIVKLNARQACAIESAALTNPTWNVFVLFASPVGFEIGVPKPALIEALESYTNINLRNVNLWTYTEKTPAFDWLQSGHLFKSSYLAAHTADFLRLLSLYKWGGTHIDLDFIMKKTLSNLNANYAGTESVGYIANGLLNFNITGVGHDMVKKCIDGVVTTYDGTSWAGIGPTLITRILKDFCAVGKCDFTQLPIDDLYAIRYTEWNMLFDAKQTEVALNRTRDSIAVHFWNKLSENKRIKVGDNVAYGRLAAEYCPKVYRSCGEYF